MAITLIQDRLKTYSAFSKQEELSAHSKKSTRTCPACLQRNATPCFAENMKKSETGLIFFGILPDKRPSIAVYWGMHSSSRGLTKKKIPFSKEWLFHEFERKIATLDWKAVRRDVENFLRAEDRKFVANWSRKLFESQVSKIELK
jgi:hypothetical protein